MISRVQFVGKICGHSSWYLGGKDVAYILWFESVWHNPINWNVYWSRL